MEYPKIESIPKSGYEIKSVKRMPGAKPIIVIILREDEEFELNIALDDFVLHLIDGFNKVCSNQEVYQKEGEEGKILVINSSGEKCFEIGSMNPNLIIITACKEKTKEVQLGDFLEIYARKLGKEIE